MGQYQFFTNHLQVLKVLAARPDLRLREIAGEVGITERGTHRIISELIDDGYLTRTRVGARNRYQVHADTALRHPLRCGRQIQQVLHLMTSGGDEAHAAGEPAPGSSEGYQTPAHGDSEAQRTRQSDSDLFRAMFTGAPAGMVVADATGRLLTVNPAFCNLLGRREDEVVGRQLREFTHPDDVAADEKTLVDVLSGELPEYVREKRYLRPDGSSLWVKVRAAAAPDAGTGVRLFVAYVVDISERKRQEEVLAEAEERFRSAFDNAPIGMALVAPEGRWIKVNRSLCELTGYAETELLRATFQSITHPDDLDVDLALVEDVLAGRRRSYQLEKRYYHADGHLIWAMLSVSLVRDASGAPLYFIAQIEDVSEGKRREQALRKHAEQLAVIAATDPLTGLSTRRAWDAAIAQHMRHGPEDDRQLAVALLDLDGLKTVNDSRGHHAGDAALRAVAATLRKAVRDGDRVARFGGDEFAILIPGTTPEAMLALIERILGAVPEPLSASAGIAMWHRHETADQLLQRADAALYSAKRAGRGQVREAIAATSDGPRPQRRARRGRPGPTPGPRSSRAKPSATGATRAR
jgi:diguanylate cyclase (GGDEF)-like protein/PAS domain S-box-containing protein